MTTDNIFKLIKKRVSELDRKKLIVFLGLAGMLLILLSELMPKNDKSESKPEMQSEDILTDDYKEGLENELADIISNIDGTGETKVMLTLDGTTEYVYAEEQDTSSDNNEASKRESFKNKIVITESGGDKKALIKKIIRPQVTGVLIACAGGDDIHIKEKIIGAVSAVLAIPAGRVCVEKLKV